MKKLISNFKKQKLLFHELQYYKSITLKKYLPFHGLKLPLIIYYTSIRGKFFPQAREKNEKINL